MFEQLGVRPLINAATSLTAPGGSLMPPAKILDAVSSGSDSVSDLLREHIGRFFERIEGAEWA